MQYKNIICTDICALKETVDVSLMSSFLKTITLSLINRQKSRIGPDDLNIRKIIIKIIIIKREKEKRFTINKMKADFLLFRFINRVSV